MSILLRAQGVGKTFGQNWIFRGLDFEVSTGQVLVIRGRNGSGKSTLLKGLAGLMPFSEGSVVREEPIGLAGLDLSTYGGLSGAEHMQLFGHDPAALQCVGLADAAQKLASEYSTGMRARLKLALASGGSPKILFLDEPTAALDDAGREIVGETIRRQTELGAVVFATNLADDLRWATHELNLG